MTGINLTTLKDIQDLTFTDFKAAHQVGNNVAVNYYNRLEYEGFQVGNTNISNYAKLAENVAANSGISGGYANSFSKSVADNNGINFTVGSDNWLQMQYDLMQGDFSNRESDILSNGTGELNFQQTNDIYAFALDNVGLPPEAFSLYTPLSQIAKSDIGKAQQAFENALPGEGLFDLFLDGAYLRFNADISTQQELADILRDYGSQAQWSATALDATGDFLNYYQGDPGPAQDLLDKLEAIFDLTGAGFNTLADWAEGIQGLADQYGGGFNIPFSFFGSTPDFINEALAPYDGAKTAGSPLVLDLDGDGVELTAFDSLTTTTFFDIDGDGFAEQTAWVSPDDGLLVRDLNANGTIDDVTELFGSLSVDGFAKLLLLDDNGDLLIDQFDDAWSELSIWQDSNGDAVTQNGELISLTSLNIESIDLAGVVLGTAMINGNAISHESTFKYTDGTTGDIVDAWFVHDDINTIYSEDYVLDIQTLFLPTLRGFGEIVDLHIAMSSDSALLNLVDQFVVDWDLSRFSDPASLDSDVENILFKWAGVDTVDPNSRGWNVDARHLAFLENIFADDFLQRTQSIPAQESGRLLELSYDMVFTNLKTHLLAQVGVEELYSSEISYNLFTGTVDGAESLSQSFIDSLEVEASKPGVDAEVYWLEVAMIIETTKGIDNLTTQEESWLDSSILASDSTLTWVDIKELTYPADPLPYLGQGTSANDVLNGFAGDDTLFGYEGDDILNGYDGNDILSGDSYSYAIGNDILNPGDGRDFAYGGHGDDIYVFTSGDDFYSEAGVSGSDEIKLPANISSIDLDIFRSEGNSANIIVGDLGTIEIDDFFLSSNSQIEILRFDDNSIIDLTAFNDWEVRGTDGNDDLSGENSINETIYGFDGDDELWGYDGDDVLDGGVGNDILNAGDGDDTLVISAGFDTAGNAHNRGTDTVFIPLGYTPDDVAFLRTNISNPSQYRDLVVSVENLGQLYVRNQFSTPIDQVEQVYFAETDTTISFTDIQFETRGTAGNDSLNGITTGGSVDDILNGMEGDDYLFGGPSGDDTYIFSEGTDIVDERMGTDNILFWERWNPEDITIYRGKVSGNNWSDLILEDTDGNIMAVKDHFTRVSPSDSVEYVNFYDSTQWDIYNMKIAAHGTEGNDTISSYLYGDLSNGSTIYGFGGNDFIAGYIGNDYLDGGVGDDILQGSTGDDTYIVGLGLDTVRDSSGTDTLWITGGRTINDISLAVRDFYDIKIVIDSGVNEVVVEDSTPLADSLGRYVEIIKFDDGFATDLPTFASWLWGTSGDDVIAGDSNDNTIIGMAGNDTINAGVGNDDVHGGADNDNIHGDDGDDLLYGGVGDDTLNGGAGADIINGGLGADTAGYNGSLLAVTIDLLNGTASGGDAAGDTLISIENIIGSDVWAERDSIWGDDGANHIEGLDGKDILEGGAGADIIDGGAEWDYSRYTRSDAGVSINLRTGINTGGHAEGDVLIDIEAIVGSAFNDNITGGDDPDYFRGESGDDVLAGGSGLDTLIGGNGADTFVLELASAFNNIDRIQDFDLAENDIIDISDVLNGFYNLATDVITDFVEITTNGSDSELRVDTTGSANFSAGTQITTMSNIIGLEDEAVLITSGHLVVASATSGTGTSGNDVFIGTSASETFDGLGGVDTVDYRDSLLAVTIDLLNGTASGGDAASDTLISIENIIGSDVWAERDFIWGDDGANHIEGLDGKDILEGGAGADIIDGGAEWDYSRYTRSDAGVSINLRTGINTGGHAEGDVLIDIEAIVGSAFNDNITGGDDPDYFRGESGDDVLAGGSGLDTLIGGNGADTFVLESASAFNNVDRIQDFDLAENDIIDISDVLNGFYNLATDVITDFVEITTNGSDSELRVDTTGSANFSAGTQITTMSNIIGLEDEAALITSGHLVVVSAVSGTGTSGDDIFLGTSASETFDGLGGVDTADYRGSLLAVTIDLLNGTASGGDAAGDTLISIENIIGSDVWAERDFIWGDDGANHIEGLDGKDILEGGAGADIIDGGAEWDYSRYTRSDAGVTINLKTGINTGGHAEGDVLIDIEAIVGSAFSDNITGGDEWDFFRGENGDDVLAGGSGVDTLFGGNGADVFLFEAISAFDNIDRIKDFDLAENDAIDIVDLLSSSYDPLTDAITDFVEITANGSDSELRIDTNGTANFTAGSQVATISNITGLEDEAALVTSGHLLVA